MNNLLDMSYFDGLWQNVLLMFRERMNQTSFDTWFGETRVASFDSTQNRLEISVPSLFVRNWLEQHYTGTVESALTALSDMDISVQFALVSATPQQDSKPPEPEPTSAPTDNEPSGQASGQDPLIPRYTFDTFVVGASNRFTHAACLAVSEKPGHSYNPLFIYGGVGLGKTHLMHAVGHNVRTRNPRAKVAYLSTERFMNEFIAAIRENNTGEFRNRYRSIDVLLIDDIQFIANKEQTQEEFFHTFNALHEATKQIVISSDRPPREIPTLEDRLRSRFEWGLLTDIQPPDLETRIAILQRKAKADALNIPEDVTHYIANQVDSNIRELEGALIRVIAYSSLVNEEITLQLTHEALKDIIAPSRSKVIQVHHIVKVIGDHFGLKQDDFKTKKRTRDVVFPRQIAMFLTRELTDMSLPRIGEAFGGRDHTTVLHACDKVSDEISKNPELKQTINRLSEAIRTLT